MRNKSVVAVFCILISGIAWSNTIVTSSGSGNSNSSFSNGKVIVNGKSISGDNIVIVNGNVVSAAAVTDNGQLKTEVRSVPDYVGIKLDAPVELTYKVSRAKSLKITAADNILPLITTSVTGGYLTVELKKQAILTQPIQVEASGQNIEAIKILSSSKAVLTGLDGQVLAVTINGAGDALVSGHVNHLSLAISGSGDIDASSLTTDDLDINVSGSGAIKAFANRSVSGDISGAGSVAVRGSASKRMIDVSGAGTVVYQ